MNHVRICGIYTTSRTVNPYIGMDYYPLSRIDEVFASLSSYKVFCVLDLSDEYQKLSLTEYSKKKILTFNTHKGLFQFEILPFGISSAPEIFQRVMDTILKSTRLEIYFIRLKIRLK